MSKGPPDDLSYAKDILSTEARAIEAVGERLGASFLDAVSLIEACKGQVVVTGLGKSGLVGQKISATFASTGTASFFQHAAETLHGDLGRIRTRDLVIALSHGGETEEVVRLIPLLRRLGAPLIAITADPESRLGREADVVLAMGAIDEACPLGLAPTSSTTAAMALGDALALSVSRRRSFTKEEYALYHRGGSLGRKLMRVDEIMRTEEFLPTVEGTVTVRDTLQRVSAIPDLRAGAALVIDDDGLLVGIFTDGDLKRHVQQDPGMLDRPVAEVMTPSPKTVLRSTLVADAQNLMKQYRIDEVPVVDEAGRPVGVVDVQDLLEVGFAL